MIASAPGSACSRRSRASSRSSLAGDADHARGRPGSSRPRSVFVGFAGALVAFVDALERDPETRVELSTAYTWLGAGEFEVCAGDFSSTRSPS